MIIIGIAGKARHGKDTVADHLVARHGFFKLSFASAMRDMLELGMGIEPHWLHEGKNEVIPWIGTTGRHLMQTLGTEWGRCLVKEDLWLDVVRHRIDANADEDSRIVISDVRFPNEASLIRLRGRLWHVLRPNAPAIIGGGHRSEAGVAPIIGEPILFNVGTVSDLLQRVDGVMEKLVDGVMG